MLAVGLGDSDGLQPQLREVPTLNHAQPDPPVVDDLPRCRDNYAPMGELRFVRLDVGSGCAIAAEAPLRLPAHLGKKENKTF